MLIDLDSEFFFAFQSIYGILISRPFKGTFIRKGMGKGEEDESFISTSAKSETI